VPSVAIGFLSAFRAALMSAISFGSSLKLRRLLDPC
jgi:ABC-type nitrate/sulfonate/bicarbonate transport system permease component